MKKLFFAAGAVILAACSAFLLFEPKNDGWIELFNGKDLNDWNIKIAKHAYRENYANTFRVENGVIRTGYEGYGQFDQQYGHIFYKKPFSAYILRLEYRFVGEQAKGGEGWAWRNSGAMLHCQDPSTMLKDQDFPISIEGQLLGGDGEHLRHTSNLCTPGTNVVWKDKLFTPHCLDSKSKTYHGDRWVRADFVVLADSVVYHVVEGDTVLTYYKPQIGGGNVTNFNPQLKKDGQLLKSGYIALQSESHPVEFRRVALFNLEPYMKNKKKLAAVLARLQKAG
ncbi:DUF1080 domain-containing protein [Pedobacter yulinensis]|uniref:DUF1080 domain-containing protein n=1 Tax=Pedobacter yulinensis TaxID=2126353 RepID=A0A2T3HH00_9SPHI|nr:DUF1080 domain-containing protein [Pedobacter yulinensis]PST81725.1 DUF1080 domain-containing protein [Pedobacter yulinensis]